jgi:hypothetical protein
MMQEAIILVGAIRVCVAAEGIGISPLQDRMFFIWNDYKLSEIISFFSNQTPSLISQRKLKKLLQMPNMLVIS